MRMDWSGAMNFWNIGKGLQKTITRPFPVLARASKLSMMVCSVSVSPLLKLHSSNPSIRMVYPDCVSSIEHRRGQSLLYGIFTCRCCSSPHRRGTSPKNAGVRTVLQLRKTSSNKDQTNVSRDSDKASIEGRKWNSRTRALACKQAAIWAARTVFPNPLTHGELESGIWPCASSQASTNLEEPRPRGWRDGYLQPIVYKLPL